MPKSCVRQTSRSQQLERLNLPGTQCPKATAALKLIFTHPVAKAAANILQQSSTGRTSPLFLLHVHILQRQEPSKLLDRQVGREIDTEIKLG